VDSAMKDAGLDDVKKDLQGLKNLNPMSQIKNEIGSPSSSKSNDFDKYFGAPDEAPKP
jgi:hypothetical protein